MPKELSQARDRNDEVLKTHLYGEYFGDTDPPVVFLLDVTLGERLKRVKNYESSP